MYYTFSISKDFHGRVTLSVHDTDGLPVALNVKLPDDSADELACCGTVYARVALGPQGTKES